MGIGDLVSLQRASIGLPKGSVGLIIKEWHQLVGILYEIRWTHRTRMTTRYERDLELIE